MVAAGFEVAFDPTPEAPPASAEHTIHKGELHIFPITDYA